MTVLRNGAVELERAGETLRLIGIDDPDFGTWTGGEAGLAALLADLEAVSYTHLHQKARRLQPHGG